MKRTSIQKRHAYLVTGGIGLVLAASYLWLSFQMPFGRLDQPGAGVFPVIVGVILVLVSMATMREGGNREKSNGLIFLLAQAVIAC